MLIGNIPVNGKDGCYSITEYQEAKTVAVQALEEIQQYRAIGTTEECRAAVEKEAADGCSDCAFETVEEWEMPCAKCKRNCKDYWRRRASDEKI